MATIALNGTSINFGMGICAFDSLGTAFSSAKKTTGGLQKAIGNLITKIDLAKTAAKVETAQTEAKNAKTREETKESSLTLAYDKLDTLINDVGTVDNKVSTKVSAEKNDFYKKYEYLKPECEKSLKEKIKDGWNSFCDKVTEIVGGFVEWCKEHWKEILVGLAFIVVGALITVLTAGTGTAFWAAFGAALLKGFATALVAGAIGGVVNSAITYGLARLSGKSKKEAAAMAKKAFGDGFAAGFMLGGIGFAGGAFGSAFGTTYKTFRVIQYTAKASGVVSGGMMAFDLVSQIAGALDPKSKLFAFNKSLHDNKLYSGFQKFVTGLAVFSGGAYNKAEITDGSHMYKNANGDMVPRDHVKYRTGEDGTTYHYVTGRKGENGAGIIKEGYAERLELKGDRSRYRNETNTPGKLNGDDAGHIFGDRFNGSRKLDNLTSQARDVNQRRSGVDNYFSMEQKWADAMGPKGGFADVTNVKVRINYGFKSSRPSVYKVTYKINGEAFKNVFKNVNFREY